MEKIAYFILITLVVLWLFAIVFGFVIAFPVGLIGLLFIISLGLLFIKVLKEKIRNKSEDDKYKDVRW